MTIRNRLTLLFTAIVSGLLLLFCLVLHLVAERLRANEYRERLRAEAITSAELLFGQQTISPQLYKLLDKNHMTVLNEEEIIIYNYHNQIVYESGTDYLTVTKDQLDQIRLDGEVYWRLGDREIVGVRFANRDDRLVVLASAVDKYGFRKQWNLAMLLIGGWALATLVVFVAGRFFAGRALRPIRRVIAGIDTITASQLSTRLPEGPDADEITQLAQRFNQMLDRLEDAFRLQRMFVSNASHELRTPLTAITGQLEVALLAGDDEESLRSMIRSVLDDVRDLNRLTNGLLSLAKVSMDESAVQMVPVALDELIWQTRADLLKMRPEGIVTVELGPQSPGNGQVSGSEPLLRTALFNLLENGIKFAPDHRVMVQLTAEECWFILTVHNDGPIIPADELPDIFKPFRRGSNGQHTDGHGIGLSLTQRIVQLHRGRLSVTSDAKEGTTFRLNLPQF